MTAPVENLLAATGRGDADAFTLLYDAFAPRLLGLIVTILGGRRDADDVLQEVFREIWNRADRYDAERGSQETWLIMLTRCRAIDHLRRRVRRRGAEMTRSAPAMRDERPAPVESAGRRDLADRAHEGLARLPDEQRDAVSLAFFHGLTAAQIADLRHVPLGTVKTRIRLGMRKLRDHLQPQETHP